MKEGCSIAANLTLQQSPSTQQHLSAVQLGGAGWHSITSQMAVNTQYVQPPPHSITNKLRSFVLRVPELQNMQLQYQTAAQYQHPPIQL